MLPRPAPPDEFQAYRLGDESHVRQHTHALQHAPWSHRSAAAAALGYKELKARAALAPLASYDGTTCVYLSQDHKLVLVYADGQVGERVLAELPATTRAAGADPMPAVHALDAWSWAVSGGERLALVLAAPDLYVVDVVVPAREEEEHAAPWCVVHAAWAGDDALLLLQRVCRQGGVRPGRHGLGAAPHDAAPHARTETHFEVAHVRVPRVRQRPAAVEAQCVWTVRGDENVRWAHTDGAVYVLGAEAPFRADGDATRAAAATPAADEAAATEAVAPAAAPYAWTQTPDTVMLAFSLPRSTDKAEVRCHFSPRGMSLSLAAAEARVWALDDPQPEALLRRGAYQSRALWADIDPDASVWTWEAVGDAMLLSVHLAKRHEGTRWPAVFAEDDHVDETLDARDLAAALQRTDAYTAPGAGGLLHDSFDDDEALPGAPLVLTSVTAAGAVSTSSDTAVLLATHAPGTAPAALAQYGVDGHVLAPPAPSLGAGAPWPHLETLPGIGYVLASKKDAHPVYVVPRAAGIGAAAVIAAELRYTHASRGGSWLYVYGVPGAPSPPAAAPMPAYGLSRVLPVSAAASGPVLGLAVTQDAQVLCLCASALVAVTNALPAPLGTDAPSAPPAPP